MKPNRRDVNDRVRIRTVLSDMHEYPDIQSMDRALAERLLAGSCGRSHLLDCADLAVQKFRRCDTIDISEYQRLAQSLAVAAWESDPFDNMLADRVLTLHRTGPGLGEEMAAVVTAVAQAGAVPEGAASFRDLLVAREMNGILARLEQELTAAPDSVWWLRQAALHGLYQGEFHWLDRVLSGVDAAPLVPLADRMRGEAAMMDGDLDRALKYLEKSYGSLPLPGTLERISETRRRTGGDALDVLLDVVRVRPWHVSALLAAYDLHSGMSDAGAPPKGRGTILFYTFNKADELDAALEAVAKSERYGAPVVVLDNGSTDHTADVIDRWASFMGADASGSAHLVSVRLPLNVGAPAARNWLASLDIVREADWAAYMDDDALVQPDWLGRFGAAMQAYPDAGVWGARIMDHSSPQLFQSTDLFFLDPAQAGQGVAAREKRLFRISGLQHQVLDTGQFRHVRPCGSVTGCVHLFRTERLLVTGGFDVRFSPSQYDDLDHDLRLCLAGCVPVYQGHLSVRHMKRTGKGAFGGDVASAGPLANMYKLQAKHSAQDVAALRETVFQAALEDYLAKRSALSAAYPGIVG